MSRDELAFQILLKIMESPDLRQSILGRERELALNDKDFVYNPAAAFARVAWKQADEFIAAGVTAEQRQRLNELNMRQPLKPPLGPQPDWMA